MLQTVKQLQHARLSQRGVVSGLKFMGHGNPDNNLESYCTYFNKCHGRYPYKNLKRERRYLLGYDAVHPGRNLLARCFIGLPIDPDILGNKFLIRKVCTFYRTTRHRSPEYSTHHRHVRESLRSSICAYDDRGSRRDLFG
jgi:hypothetical protein